MLEDLRIRSLGVIEDATITFGPGLNVVTGETGAGKTMVVIALGLLLGVRADPSLVRSGAEHARIEARLRLAAADGPGATARTRVEEAGGVLDDGDTLLIGRLVFAAGRSRATAGGAGVPAGVLGDVTSDLVVVHGQSDQQRLLQSGRQRDLLDVSGGQDLLDARDRYRAAYRRLAEVDALLAEVAGRARERAHEADLLRLGLDEIARADPQPGEDVALLDEERRLAHADGLRTAAERAHQALAGDDSGTGGPDALGLVAAARASLAAEAANDPALAALAENLAGASYALADAAADIASYAASVDTDPARLENVAQRRAVLLSLTRKYGDTIEDVLAWAGEAQRALGGLDDDETRLAALHDEREQLGADMADLSAVLTGLRRAAADSLASRVSAELASLAMGGTAFRVRVGPLAEPTGWGGDDVTFLLEVPGGSAVPVARGASGGELSRVMLALELCLNDDAPAPTLVFDEVDAGVGGRAAVELGRRLSRLAESTQVVVVTHLPQVAAFADHHLVVTKSSDGSVGTSGVRALDDEGRLRELSRMLAGLQDSETAIAHARELVDLARRTRPPTR